LSLANQTFELVGEIADVDVIAVHRSIRDLKRLNNQYGRGRWRKLKGRAVVRLSNQQIRNVEVHWYEAHGIGKREIRIKKYF
jgi:hypothetical protein